MILKNITQAKQFLPSLNLTLENDRFNDFFLRAQQWLASHIIGPNLETVLEQTAPPLPDDQDEPEEPEITVEEDITETNEGDENNDEPATEEHANLRRRCQRIIAERALLDAIPEMDMQLTEAGFAVQDNDNFSPASAQRVDRLITKMPERIIKDVDSLVDFLLQNSKGTQENPMPYDTWRGTEQFKYLTAAFMPLLEQCNCFATKRFESYDDFYSAIPTMAEELQQVASFFVSDGEIDRLLEMFRDNQLLAIHVKAVRQLRFVAAASYENAVGAARNHAICARNVMLSDPNSFPEFKASQAFTQKDINLDGGKTVNFL